MESLLEDNKNDTIHFHKINIFGDSGVGKTSLISCMENFTDDNFEIKEDLHKNSNEVSFEASSSIVEQIKKLTFNINDNRKVYYNIYETSINRYNEIKINLDVLLKQTECIIIMWNNSDTDTFDNIQNLVLTIKDSKDITFDNIPIFLVQNKIDLELNESKSSKASKASRSEKEIINTINEIKNGHSNIIHKKISLLNKNDYQELILDIDRKLNNKVEKKNKEIYDLVKFKYPFNIDKMNPDNSYIKKYIKNTINIVLLGDSNTGKTSFLLYLDEKPIDNGISTVGINDYPIFADVCDENAIIKIMDTAGQERYNSLSNDLTKKAHGFLLFFDVTNKSTFNSLDKYIDKIKSYNGSNEIILLGNKIDESEHREVQKQDAKTYADNKDIKYYECSSKYGINILEVLNEITFMSFKRYKVTYKNDDNSIIEKKDNQNNKSGCHC